MSVFGILGNSCIMKCFLFFTLERITVISSCYKYAFPCQNLFSVSIYWLEIEQHIVGIVEKKPKRAATKDIARLALEDLAKYFDVPIIQASKNLKVGLSVLKKKCREFGIPRWPHRKIKSLDSLIRDLQVCFLPFI